LTIGREGRVAREAARVLEAGVAGQVFPGAAAALGWWSPDGAALVQVAAGRLSPQGAGARVETFYDLGSVTMGVVAATALRLVASGRISLDVRADEVLSDVRGGPVGGASLGALLRHEAGLAPWGGLYLDVPHDLGSPAARRWLVAEASRRPLDASAGERPGMPSDLGYLIAGELLARSEGVGLDRLVCREVTDPLGLDGVLLYPAGLNPEARSDFVQLVAPTERCEWRGRIVRGEVQDENCTALGGVAGHAGLFATVAGLARFGAAILDALGERTGFLAPALLRGAGTSAGATPSVVGFSPVASERPRVGRRLGPQSFGSNGLPGGSLWIDPGRELSVVLLSNRVHPSRANTKIEGFRPAFHDAVVAAFDGR
jgi:CubicO group peptidase (beta-lactamase class C family)